MDNNSITNSVENNNTTNNEDLSSSVTENITVADDATIEKLDLIHQDLGFIICFIVFFVLVVLLKYAYKFFDMCFKF